jgi:hypothetical protein
MTPALTSPRAIALLIVVIASGCVVRTQESEVYLGPVFLRATDACRGGTTAVQSVQVGVMAEVGSQTGVSVGFAERVAVTPRIDPPDEPACDRWEVIGGIPGAVDTTRWTLSPLYARRHVGASPQFVWRRLYGAQATAGAELSALSVGAVSRTELRSDGDGFYSLTFDTTRPMQSEFRKWPYRPGEAFPMVPRRREE